MPNKIIKPLLFIALLSCAANVKISANGLPNLATPSLFSDISYGDNFSFAQTNTISTKSGEKYDEPKDPALRKGTENWEEKQGSYFAIPALVIGIMALVLFFNRGS